MKNDALHLLLELAQANSDAAAKAIGASCTREHKEEDKLQMLINYRLDYQNNYMRAIQQGVSPASLANYEEFMKKLDLAVKQQAEVVAHCRRQVVQSRQDWEQKQRRVKSFDALTQRQQLAETRREVRVEQRTQDEYAARLFARAGDDE